MKKASRCGLYAAILILMAVWLGFTTRSNGDKVSTRERKFTFDYQTTVKDIPVGTKKVEIWVPVPHDSPYQQITDLQIKSPVAYVVQTGANGNKILHISLNDPHASDFSISMRFTAIRREHIQDRLNEGTYATQPHAPNQDMVRWLQPDRLAPIDGQIKKWAQEVVDAAGAKTDLQKARAIYTHVISTVKYDKTGQGWGRGDIYYACDARRGNCTDFHAIFIGYVRAVGIPARFAIGFPLPTDRPAGEVSGYHCWAEFYLNGIGWVPVDASEAAKNPAKREYFFGAHDENRVEFSIGRDLIFHPNQAEPLNYFVYPYVEVDGKPFTSVEKSFTYRDLSHSARGPNAE